MFAPTATATNKLSTYEAVAITDETSHPDNHTSWVQAHMVEVKDETNETAQIPQSQEITISSTKYNDVAFAIAFLIHLVIVIAYGVFHVLTSDYSSVVQNDFITIPFSVPNILFLLVLPVSLISFAIVYHAVAVIAIRAPTSVIHSALTIQTFLNTTLMLFWFLTMPGLWSFIFLIVGSGISIWYYFAVQAFIPFAAANLKLAAMGIRSNMGVFLVSLGMGVIGFVYFLAWVFVGSGAAVEAKDNFHEGNYYYYGDGSTSLLFVALLFSMYWTLTVTSNVSQTTVAGVMGTWCFDRYNPTAVSGSFFRSMVTSFGSICFGSLLNAIIMTLRYLATNARQHASANDQDCAVFLACIAQCILACLQDIIEYFNQWAYIFVGVYGTSYLESGKMVFELFMARGFTSIISTDLVSYFLFCMVFISGLLSGLFGILFFKASEKLFGTYALFGSDETSLWIPFGICFVVGLVIAASVTNVIQAAVKTIIVCYADDPFKMYENHPEETSALSNSLGLVFPGVASPIFSDILGESNQGRPNVTQV